MRLYALLNREFQICKCVLFFFFLLLHHSSPFISKYFFLLPYDRIKPEFSINLKGQVNGVGTFLNICRCFAKSRSAFPDKFNKWAAIEDAGCLS